MVPAFRPRGEQVGTTFNDGERNPMTSNLIDDVPDVRDGFTRKERIILYCLDQMQKERRGRNVPTAMLYGRVIEYVDMSMDELQAAITAIKKPSQS